MGDTGRNWSRTYADDLACRWAERHLELEEGRVERIDVSYYGSTGPYSSWTPGDPSALDIFAHVPGYYPPDADVVGSRDRVMLDVTFPQIIDGMVALHKELVEKGPL